MVKVLFLSPHYSRRCRFLASAVVNRLVNEGAGTRVANGGREGPLGRENVPSEGLVRIAPPGGPVARLE